jgi:hypothetical protein
MPKFVHHKPTASVSMENYFCQNSSKPCKDKIPSAEGLLAQQGTPAWWEINLGHNNNKARIKEIE